MNRSVRFLVSVFCLALAVFGASLVASSEAQATTPSNNVLARQDLGDFDGDGNPNVTDPDDDNDGVVDVEDADPFDPNIWNESQLPTAVPEPLPTSPPAPAPTAALVPTPAPTVTEPSPSVTELPTEIPAEAAPEETVPAAPVTDVPAAPVTYVPAAPVNQVPVVAALPETGAGIEADSSTIAAMAAMSTLILLGAGTQLRKIRV